MHKSIEVAVAAVQNMAKNLRVTTEQALAVWACHFEMDWSLLSQEKPQ